MNDSSVGQRIIKEKSFLLPRRSLCRDCRIVFSNSRLSFFHRKTKIYGERREETT